MSLPHYGDELPSFMKRLVDEHTYYRRARVPKEVVATLRARQEDKCHSCGDKLYGKGDVFGGQPSVLPIFEVHHASALAEGGGNDAGNLQLLCHMCHVKISEEQHLCKNPRLRSCFNPEVMELFNNTPKPRQIHWGLGAVGEEGSLATVWSVDINGCRRNALLLAKSLPSFNFTDEPEPYNPAQFDQYDFLWVDNGVDLEGEGYCGCVARGNRIDCEYCSGSGIPQMRLRNAPYDGPHLYPMAAVRYLLDRKIMTPDHIT